MDPGDRIDKPPGDAIRSFSIPGDEIQVAYFP